MLGYVLNADGIKTDPDKVAVIANLLPPTTVKETRSFLGMCNYYRNSLPNYATVAEPLIALTRGMSDLPGMTTNKPPSTN